MKAIKKSLCIILALIFMVQIIPFTAFADEPETQPEPEVIVNSSQDEGGYVPEEPELLEPEEPESGDPEATEPEAPILYRDGLQIGIYNPNVAGTVAYKINNGDWTNYAQPFYLDAYQTASVSARVTLNNEEAVTTENISSDFEGLFAYSEVVSDFCLKYKTVNFDFVRAYQGNEWFFATDSNVSADASGYFYNGILPNGTEMIFAKVNQTTYQNPTTGYVLNVLYSGSTLSGYTITIDNIVYTYNAAGKIVDVHSIYGDTIEISRTSAAIEVSDGEDRSYTISLNAQGRPVCITDPLEGTITYTYSSGLLSTVTDQSGVVIGNYQYTAGVLTKNGDKTITRDALDRVTSIVCDSGAYENYIYDNTLNKVTTATSTDNVTDTCYNEAGEVLSTADESNNTSAYTYDAAYNLLTETVDGELTTTNTYTNGLLTSSTDSENVTTYYTYSNGRIATETTGDTITEYSYTQAGELEAVETRKEIHESAGGEEGAESITINIIDDVEYVYDDGLLIETFDNKNNESVEYTYDEYGNVTAKDVTVTGSNPSTAHTSSTYDLMGNLLTETQGSDTTAYVYDAAGRTLKSTSAGGEVTRTVYDAQGRVVQEIGPEDYDAQDDGLPSSTAYSDNTVGTRYVYAANGTLTSTTDRLDRTTTYTYNSVGSKVKEAFDIYEYYYLNHGEKWKTTIAGSIYMTCSYSNDGKYRLLQEAYANGDEKNYTYNAHGDITAVEDESDNILFAFTYDTDNVLTEKDDYQRGLTYTYDGDTVEVYKTSDNTLLYSYENTSQEGENEPTTADETHFGTAISTRSSEHSIAYIAGNTEVDYEDTFTNDYLTVSTVSVGNNDVMSTEYTYDAHDNITEKSIDCGSNDIAFGYTYDSENRIVSESYNQDEVYHYYYNANDQLVRANNNLVQSSATYTYDSRGNITSKKSYESLATDVSNLTPDLKTVFTYETSGWTDRLTQVTKSIKILGTLYDYEFNTVTYDDIGNVLTYGNKSYTWENGRNLTAITEGNTTYSYTYDEEGIRTSKTVGGTTTYFNYDNGQLLSQSDGTNTFIFQYDASGNPSGFLYNGTQYFYITNAVGDIIAFVDSQNNFCAMYYYVDSAWGSYMEIDAATNAMRALANLNPFRYKGYYYDAETGYYYLQSRYYDPDICRFINADCYCDTGTGTVYSTNMFAYCENDPVNCVDRFGFSVSLENLYSKNALSFLMYSLVVTNKRWGTKYIFNKNQAIGKKMKSLLDKSIGLKNYIRSLEIKKYSRIKFNNCPVNFKNKKSVADLDLYLSFGWVRLNGFVYRVDNRHYYLDIVIRDLFDFDNMTKGNLFVILINNILGYFPQQLMMIKPYLWEFRYNNTLYI